jgi:hypothetical protein
MKLPKEKLKMPKALKPKIQPDEKPIQIIVMVPAIFWKELVECYEQQKLYNSYAEMYRHLLKVGVNALKKDSNGREVKQ